jgi:hypothetical protein
MKTLKFLLAAFLIISGSFARSQNKCLPDVDILTLEGIRVNASDVTGTDSLVVVLFWNISDLKSLEQLYSLNEAYGDLRAEHVKMIGICTDISVNMLEVKPFVYGHDIGIEIYLDKNNDLKRAMSVPVTPYTFLFDQDKNIQAVVMGSCKNILDVINDMRDNFLASAKDKKK